RPPVQAAQSVAPMTRSAGDIGLTSGAQELGFWRYTPVSYRTAAGRTPPGPPRAELSRSAPARVRSRSWMACALAKKPSWAAYGDCGFFLRGRNAIPFQDKKAVGRG